MSIILYIVHVFIFFAQLIIVDVHLSPFPFSSSSLSSSFICRNLLGGYPVPLLPLKTLIRLALPMVLLLVSRTLFLRIGLAYIDIAHIL